jgi:hypothetical protein
VAQRAIASPGVAASDPRFDPERRLQPFSRLSNRRISSLDDCRLAHPT